MDAHPFEQRETRHLVECGLHKAVKVCKGQGDGAATRANRRLEGKEKIAQYVKTMSTGSYQLTEEEALQLFQNAQKPAEIRSALLQSTHLINTSPNVGVAIRKAQDQLRRMKKLKEKPPEPLPPTRQTSHDERIALIERMRRGDNTAEKEIKDNCHDTKCRDCKESQEYQAVCLNFLLQCLSLRVKRRLRGDSDNGYQIHDGITAFMNRLVNDPVRVWIHETKSFYNLPSWLDHEFATVVQPSDDGTRKAKKEVKEYGLHKDSIAKIIASIGRCEEKEPQ